MVREGEGCHDTHKHAVRLGMLSRLVTALQALQAASLLSHNAQLPLSSVECAFQRTFSAVHGPSELEALLLQLINQRLQASQAAKV